MIQGHSRVLQSPLPTRGSRWSLLGSRLHSSVQTVNFKTHILYAAFRNIANQNNFPIINQTLSPSSSENSNGSYRQKKQLVKCNTPRNHIPKITLMVNNKVANNAHISKAFCKSCKKNFSNLEMLPQDQIKHVTKCVQLMPFILEGFKCKYCQVSYR